MYVVPTISKLSRPPFSPAARNRTHELKFQHELLNTSECNALQRASCKVRPDGAMRGQGAGCAQVSSVKKSSSSSALAHEHVESAKCCSHATKHARDDRPESNAGLGRVLAFRQSVFNLSHSARCSILTFHCYLTPAPRAGLSKSRYTYMASEYLRENTTLK